MTWVWIAAAAWVLLAIVVALVIGRAIRTADRQRRNSSNFVVDEVHLDDAAPEAQRRSGPRSVVQNCVPAAERTPAHQPTLPRPRS